MNSSCLCELHRDKEKKKKKHYVTGVEIYYEPSSTKVLDTCDSFTSWDAICIGGRTWAQPDFVRN